MVKLRKISQMRRRNNSSEIRSVYSNILKEIGDYNDKLKNDTKMP